MTDNDPEPSAGNVLDLLLAFRRSQTLFAAVSLGVFDALSRGPRTTAELAAELGSNPSVLERLLDACVGLKLLVKQVDRYANTPEADAYLTSTSPSRLTGYINYSSRVLWSLWAHLDDAVREGTHRWQQAFGWDGPIFSSFFHSQESKREFLMGMHGYGQISSPQVVSAFDLSGFRRLVDLGGGTGHLAIAACERYSELEAILFDLPEAAELAREIIGASPVSGRVRFIPGDFFNDPLPSADLYALGRILHDWSDDKILALLGRVYQALSPGGGILIAEKFLLETKDGPDLTQMQDLNMLVCTEGRERSLSEYADMLAHAGFVEVQGMTTTAPLDAILATKT
ncbi:MAG: class I SAM-dependent methyltransferase [Isosphaeraceae bacterium]